MKKAFFLFSFLCFFFSLQAWQKITILSKIPGQAFHYAGHKAVNRSLVRGLTLQNACYNFNPASCADIGDVVLVPANAHVLEYAINLKREKRISLLLAGPNMFVRPNECNSLLAHPLIDCVIVPSEWVEKAYYEDTPALKGRIAVWPAGVDTDFWSPDPDCCAKNEPTLIIYHKLQDEKLYKDVDSMVRKHGWKPIIISYHGSYEPDDYRNALKKARGAIFLSRSESQGIALAEAWSCNVPTFVWDPQEPHMISNKWYWPISSAPYLTPCTGAVWRTLNELDALLDRYTPSCIASLFSPRTWVLEHMSDMQCAASFLAIVNRYSAQEE